MRLVRLLSTVGLFFLIFPALPTSLSSAALLPPCAKHQLLVLTSSTQRFAGTSVRAFAPSSNSEDVGW